MRSNKARLFVARSTAVTDVPHECPSTLLTSVSPRSGASSPSTSVVVPPGGLCHGNRGLSGASSPSTSVVVPPGPRRGDRGLGHVSREDFDVEDLILDSESRRTMIQSTRGVAQLAASRRAATRNTRPVLTTYVTLPSLPLHSASSQQ